MRKIKVGAGNRRFSVRIRKIRLLLPRCRRQEVSAPTEQKRTQAHQCHPCLGHVSVDAL